MEKTMKKRDASGYIQTDNQWKHSINEKPYINEIKERFIINESKKSEFLLSIRCKLTSVFNEMTN